jgi:hypothetical protein
MAILTWADVEKAAKMSYGDGFSVKLKDLAEFINREIPELKAEISEHAETPYMKYKGSRIRHDFKRRYGHRLEIKRKTDDFLKQPLVRHETTDPYRRNWEVARWIIDWREGKIK